MTELTVDPPEDIDSLDDLVSFLSDLAERHNALVREVERVDENTNGVFPRLSSIDDDLAELDNQVHAVKNQLDDVNGHVETVEASMPDQQKGKLEKVEAILDYAYTHASGGAAGVVVETGEATAACGASRQTALRLMDEIAGSFSWAKTQNPGGPKPKQLRVATRAHEKSELVGEVHEQFA